MTIPFNQWLTDVNGKFIDVDGSYGAQCWDLAQDYLTRVVGGGQFSTAGGQHDGYAAGAWEGFATNGLSQWFTQQPATATPGPGWVGIWKYGGPFTPTSHVAPVVRDGGLGTVYCMTQNPGPAHYQSLPKAGLLGYLQPKTSIGGATDAKLTGDVTSSVGGTVGTIQSLTQIGNFFSNVGNWQRIGVMSLGGLLLLIALIFMVTQSRAVQSTVKAAIS